MRWRATRRYVHELFAPKEGGTAGEVVDWFIMLLISANVIAVIAGTVEGVTAQYGDLLAVFELLSVLTFTLEYVARLWSAIEYEEYDDVVLGRLRFAARPLSVVDLIAILPFYLTAAGLQIDLRVLRALRLVRLFRLLKLARYSDAVASLGRVYRSEREKLALTVFANALLLVLSSSIMYFIEHPHQPEVFSSIPATFYWAMVTLTTVGYGNITPATTAGQFTAGVIAFLGVGMFALPASILASGFIEEADRPTDDDDGAAIRATPDWTRCPYCGRYHEEQPDVDESQSR